MRPLALAEDRPAAMIPLLAAVGATVTALLELSVAPYLRVGDAQPHLVLVLLVVVTVGIGFEAGIAWAFVGGLVLDVLAQRPLGSTAFALLLCVGVTTLLARPLSRVRPLAPVIIVALLSPIYSMSILFAFGALRAPLAVHDPASLVLPSTIYDIVLAALIGPPVISVIDRRADQERVDW